MMHKTGSKPSTSKAHFSYIKKVGIPSCDFVKKKSVKPQQIKAKIFCTLTLNFECTSMYTSNIFTYQAK